MGARPVAVEDRAAQAWRVLAGVLDPEVPALSVVDLGIVREVSAGEGGALEIVLTPTYSGCPATEAIEADIRTALELAGLGPLVISQRLAPAWTTDWISEDGRRKLADYGIAPPCTRAGHAVVHVLARNVPCPRCQSLIEKAKVGGRGTYICPFCQRLRRRLPREKQR